MDYNKILHTSKDHQIHYVGGTEIRQTLSRWWMAAILKNRKIMVSQQLLD